MNFCFYVFLNLVYENVPFILARILDESLRYFFALNLETSSFPNNWVFKVLGNQKYYLKKVRFTVHNGAHPQDFKLNKRRGLIPSL